MGAEQEIPPGRSRASEEAAIFPSDNVAAVVEVKSGLDKDQLVSSFENILATKQLAKTAPPELPILMTSQTVACLFAFDSALSLDKISEHYYDLVRKYSITCVRQRRSEERRVGKECR